MTYVAINVLSVPDGGGDLLEQRFGARRGAVDSAPGFLSFELLRPIDGTDDYMVLTRWRSQNDFQEWTRSQSFRHGHASATGRPAGSPSSAAGSTVLTFTVVQQSWAAGSGQTPQSVPTPP